MKPHAGFVGEVAVCPGRIGHFLDSFVWLFYGVFTALLTR